jgi:hypothetical protein
VSVCTPGGQLVKPGDFAAVRMAGDVGTLIHIAEILDGDGFADYEHAITYIGGHDDLILEAQPSGARITPMHYQPSDVLWSTVNPLLDLTGAQRARVPFVCGPREGTPYSALDYLAIAAHRLHVPNVAVWPEPGFRLVTLQAYIASTRHQICSQMVDDVRQLLGFPLFAGRWDGYVTPADLANVIGLPWRGRSGSTSSPTPAAR